MRSTLFIVLLALGAGAEENILPEGVVLGPGALGADHLVEGDILMSEDQYQAYRSAAANKGGAFESDLWPGGIVPYFYQSSSTQLAFGLPSANWVFAVGSPPRILNTTADLRQTYGVGDYLVVTGSASNDNTLSTEYRVAAVSQQELVLSASDTLVGEVVSGSVTVWCTDRVSFDHVAWFEQSIAQWETTTSIDFVPRTTESDYVLIRNSQFNSSAIGHQGGVQIINMDVWDQIFVGAHELAHALGIYHEQSRPDRDNFVQINVANISTTACAGSCVPNFNIFGFAYPTYLSPIYDFDSVMHYRRGQFSGNGLDTITVLAPYNAEWQSQIGQRDHLSFWDVRVLEYLYPGGEIEFVWQESPNQNQEGSFLIPWKSLADGFAHAPSGGRLAILYPDVYTAQGVYSSPVLIEAPTGGVILQ